MPGDFQEIPRCSPRPWPTESLEGFLTNAENAGKLGGLVDDIRDAMMEYQVCGSGYLFAPRLMFVLDLTATMDLQQATRYLRQSARYATRYG